MKILNIIKFSFFIALATSSIQPVAFADDAKTYTKSEIETIVHDYIVEHPEILIEASYKLKQKSEQEAAQRDNEYIKSYKEFLFNNPNDATIGPKTAKNVIVEFSDYNCGYCKRSKQLFFKVLENHKAAGDVRYVFKEYPILGDGSEIAAKASLAVYKLYPDNFLEYHMAVINAPKRIESTADIENIVKKLNNFDWNKILEIMNSKEVAEILSKNGAMGAAMQITGTPCYIINGEFIRGAPTSIEFIENLLVK